MPQFDKHEEELMRLMFALGESLAEASTPEVLEEAKHSQVNLLDEAEEVRGILRSAGRRYLRRKLQESRQAYDAAVAEIRDKDYDLPSTPAERRRLLNTIFTERPDFEPMVLTAQHRNFNELTDEDITSFLKQLKALRLLPASPTSK